MMPNAPVLFFDSGVGGLSVVAQSRAGLPTAAFVYVADTAGFPYGTKTEAEIAARVPALLGRLVERYRPRLVVIACNTASTIALTVVRNALELPVVGTVPAIKPADNPMSTASQRNSPPTARSCAMDRQRLFCSRRQSCAGNQSSLAMFAQPLPGYSTVRTAAASIPLFSPARTSRSSAKNWQRRCRIPCASSMAAQESRGGSHI
jgi:hypothetical protein